MSNLSFDSASVAVCFVLLADCGPGLLPRVMQPFAKRDLVPDRMNALRTEDVLRVEIAMDAMPAEYVHLVEGNLRQVVGVQSVVRTFETPVAIAA